MSDRDDGIDAERLNWANLEFRFAKTLADTSHWYVVRSPANEADFVALYKAIAEHGRYEKWNGRRYKYSYPGDGYKYWNMGALYQSRVINRAKVEQARS